MGSEYNGELAVGRDANLIVLKENPVQNIDTLFRLNRYLLMETCNIEFYTY